MKAANKRSSYYFVMNLSPTQRPVLNFPVLPQVALYCLCVYVCI